MAAFIRRQLAEHKKSRCLEKPRDVMDLHLKTQSKLLKKRDKAPRQCFTGGCGMVETVSVQKPEHWLIIKVLILFIWLWVGPR